MAPWARWRMLYYKTGPSQGVVMLLVSRIGKSNSAALAACDPTLNAQVMNVRDKARMFARLVKNLIWTEHP
eukprot:6507526-Pyramimonas_sp.AAC.1